MNVGIVHQLIHGYQHGHEMLASSIRLESDDRDTITRLSDLSGSASGAKTFEAYFTAYPLPSKKYFAVAKTWPDILAKRNGCVLTHTLLVPLDLWKRVSATSPLNKHFRFPDTSDLEDFAKPIDNVEWDIPREPNANPASPSHGLEFVSRFFADGIRPIIWFDECNADSVFWQLYDGAWPELRGVLSCCTNTLQPRQLYDRPFDLMFANGNIRSRFRTFGDAHIIANSHNMRRSQAAEPWCIKWADALFLGRTQNLFDPKTAELLQILGSDPTSIGKLFLLDELTRRSSGSAMATLGILDLIAALMPEPTANVALKQQVFTEAITALRFGESPSESIRGLRLLLDRWKKKEFEHVQGAVESEFRVAVAERTSQDVLAALRASESLMSYSMNSTEPFLEGVIQGIGKVADHNPDALIVLRECPMAAPYVVSQKPQAAAAFLYAARHDSEFAPESRHLVCRWLEQITPSKWDDVLKALLPSIRCNEDRELFEHLANRITDDNAGEALDILLRSTKCFSSPGLRDAIVKSLSNRLAKSVRYWCRTNIDACKGVSYLAAGTYSCTAEGAEELLSDYDWRSSRARIWASFFESFQGGAWPSWVTAFVARNPQIVHELIRAAITDDSINDMLVSLVSAVPDVPIAEVPECRTEVALLHSNRSLNPVVDCAMRSAIRGYIRGTITKADYLLWQRDTWAREWFANVNPWIIESVVRDAADQQESWERAWNWLAQCEAAFFARPASTAHNIIAILLASKGISYSEVVASSWSEILRRVHDSGMGSSSYLKACIQAVGFAFSNPRLPLAQVVSQSFYEVHHAVTSNEHLPHEASTLFSYWEWDRAKELRRQIVEYFFRSNHPPRYLAIASREVWLLRKIAKRILRKWGGEDYLHRILDDLRAHHDAGPDELTVELEAICSDPGYPEDWD